MLIFDGQNINPNSNPIVANNAEFYTLEFTDDDGLLGFDDQDDTVTIINVSDPNNPVTVFADVSFSFEGTGVFPANATPAELAGREVAVIDVLDGSGNVIDSFFFFIDGGQSAPIANGNTRLTRNDLDVTPTPICFSEEALVDTPGGAVPVRDIRPGDMVMTTRGPEKVLYVSTSEIDALSQVLSPNTRRVRIKQGAFGPGAPARDVRVSQQHRLTVSGAVAEMLFGAETVMAPAKAFVNGDSVVIEPAGAPFSYIHFALARHATVLSSGLPVETLFVGDIAAEVLSAPDRAELTAALAAEGVCARQEAEGVLLSVREGRVLSDALKERELVRA